MNMAVRSLSSTMFFRALQAGVLLLVAVALVIVGAAAAVMGPMVAFAFAALAAVIVGFSISLEHIFLMQLFLATVIAGSLEYFAGLGQAHWVTYLLGLLLVFRALVERMRISRGPSMPLNESGGGTKAVFIFWAWLYFSVFVFSTLVNTPPLIQAFVGIKNFFFMWGVLLAFAFLRKPDEMSVKLWKAIVLIACIQLPVVLYQRYFIGAKVGNKGGLAGLSWDSVVGTFGGIPFFGGHSGSMALFVSVAIAIVLIGWREKKLSALQTAGLLLLAFPAVLFAEVKAFVIWLLIGTTLVFWRVARRRPMAFVGAMVVSAVVVVSFGYAYKKMYYDGDRFGGTSLADVYEKQIAYAYDPNKFNTETRDLGRIASLVFWWHEHSLRDPVHLFFGHGIGASRGRSSVGSGEAAKKYSFLIDTSAATVLLWDFGIVGAFSFVLMLFSGAIQGLRLAASQLISPQLRFSAECAGVSLFIVLPGILYTRDSVDDTSVQFLLYFSLAVIAIATRANSKASWVARNGSEASRLGNGAGGRRVSFG